MSLTSLGVERNDARGAERWDVKDEVPVGRNAGT
jgi:hypothetical protein